MQKKNTRRVEILDICGRGVILLWNQNRVNNVSFQLKCRNIFLPSFHNHPLTSTWTESEVVQVFPSPEKKTLASPFLWQTASSEFNQQSSILISFISTAASFVKNACVINFKILIWSWARIAAKVFIVRRNGTVQHVFTPHNSHFTICNVFVASSHLRLQLFQQILFSMLQKVWMDRIK